ncbi:energy-coupling factor ABC transporter permease [Clostridium sediminicola]|uniref:energy-coupling factor ABC transporter permease n=1 Tax=Clostridium sediminicola TaxID=3114879 RepID=UPI0031F2409D
MKKKYMFIMAAILTLCMPYTVQAMHISEGFLPPMWCLFYFVISAPFIIKGVMEIRKKTMNNKDIKMMLGLIAAFVFLLSAMKLPSVAGSSSHPTGTGLGAIIFGPFVMSVISLIVLLFQAIFLAHGGLTTLGANVFSMGIIGPIVAFVVYKLLKNKNMRVAVFLAAFLGDIVTYLVTSTELAFAIPSTTGGVWVAFIKFLGVFAITQIPIAIVEGFFTVIVFEFIQKHSKKELEILEVEV